MKINDIKALTLEAASQVLGNDYFDGDITDPKYIDSLDVSKLVDIGTSLNRFEGGTERFAYAVMDIMMKRKIESRVYEGEYPDIFVEKEEWGAFVEQIQPDLATCITDVMWNLQDGTSYATEEHKFYQPKVVSRIFNEASAVCVPYSRAKRQLMSAFKNFEEMGILLAALDVAVNNTIQLFKETYSKMLVSMGAGLSIDTRSLGNAVHLVSEYNAITGESLTSETALNSNNFLTYLCERVENIKALFNTYGTSFNNGEVNTFTPETDIRLLLLKNVATAIKFRLKANTYNEELIGLGDYKTMSCWQGKKTVAASKYAFTITTNFGSGDGININGKVFTEGVNFDAGASAADTATNLVARLNASDNPKVSGYTWTTEGAKVIATTDEGHYTEGAITAEMTEGSTGVVSNVTTVIDGRSVNALKDLSTIDIAGGEDSPFGESGFKSSYVIGLLYDKRGMGACIRQDFITSSYTAVGDFFTFFHHLENSYTLNPQFNLVAFVLD